MESEINSIVGRIIEKVEYDEQTKGWYFTISKGANLSVHCAWKLIKENKVELASGDHMQKYGLPQPINAAIKASDLLVGRKLRRIVPDKVTSDLSITFDGEISLRTFNEYTGFEAWDLVISPETEFIAQGRGKIINYSRKEKS